MLYKLSFNKTQEGLLRVSASVGRKAERAIAIYENDEVFLRLVHHAGLVQEVVESLEKAVEIAVSPARTPSCCEEIDITDVQLTFLRLGEARRLYA